MLKAFLRLLPAVQGRCSWSTFGCAVLSGLLELGFPIAVKLLRRQPAAPAGLGPRSCSPRSALLAGLRRRMPGLMVVVTYWGHVLGINIETDDAGAGLRPPAEALLRLLRQPEDRPPRSPA
jgi:hypothetical protein